MMMYRRVNGLLLGVLLLWGAAASPPAVAQDAGRAAFAGTWTLRGGVEAGRGAMQEAFDRVLASFDPFTRMMARSRLDTNRMILRRVTFAFTGDQLTSTLVTLEPHPLTTRLGYPTEVTGDDGNRGRLTQTLQPGRLQLYFTGDRGQRWMVFQPDGANGLRMNVTVDPSRIDENIRFQLRYRRQR